MYLGKQAECYTWYIKAGDFGKRIEKEKGTIVGKKVIVWLALLVFAGCATLEYGAFEYRRTSGGIIITGYKEQGSIDIPAQIDGIPVRKIGEDSFRGKQLFSVIIPDNVTLIGDFAFSHNWLTSVTIPDSVIFIGMGAFYNNQLASITMPESVTTIGEGAFSRNRLNSITIPDSVTSIEQSAFSGNQLTSVTVGNRVTSIGGSAFENNQLTSITVGNRVTSIGDFAFYRNPLTSVTIGANVNIGEDAFPSGFTDAYNGNDRQAGTYTLNGDTWTRE